MGKMSRTKGRNAERAVEVEFQTAGFETDRNLGGRNQVSGDIAAELGETRFAVEVRRRESLSVERWLGEHRDSCPGHLTPLLVTRTSRNPWMAVLTLEDFLNLLGQREGEDE